MTFQSRNYFDPLILFQIEKNLSCKNSTFHYPSFDVLEIFTHIGLEVAFESVTQVRMKLSWITSSMTTTPTTNRRYIERHRHRKLGRLRILFPGNVFEHEHYIQEAGRWTFSRSNFLKLFTMICRHLSGLKRKSTLLYSRHILIECTFESYYC